METAYTPTLEEEEIYRKVRRQHTIEDVLTEADSADCCITLKDAEAIADIIIANDGGDIPYWTTVETYLDIYLQDALERQMEAEGLHKYEVTCRQGSQGPYTSSPTTTPRRAVLRNQRLPITRSATTITEGRRPTPSSFPMLPIFR